MVPRICESLPGSHQGVPACGFSIGFERITDLIQPRPPREAIAILAETGTAAADTLAADPPAPRSRQRRGNHPAQRKTRRAAQ
jgi:hypothetical protein